MFQNENWFCGLPAACLAASEVDKHEPVTLRINKKDSMYEELFPLSNFEMNSPCQRLKIWVKSSNVALSYS